MATAITTCLSKLLTTVTWLGPTVSNSYGQVTLATDQPDYHPLATATFFGSGFGPYEAITIKVRTYFTSTLQVTNHCNDNLKCKHNGAIH